MPRRRRHGRTVPVVSTYLVWTTFVASLGLVAATTRFGFDPTFGSLIRLDGLTTVMWVAVTFFSGIVQSFSRRYMAANGDVDLFFARITLFTVAVLAMTAADHVALFVAAWTAMGLVMAELIGHVRNWPQARRAKRLSRKQFVRGSVLLAAGLAVLSLSTGAATISGILAGLDGVEPRVTFVAGALVLGAALIQSALIPFHGWLLSSMTAPTPSSALMHAGFVNAGGLLLSRLAPLFALQRELLLLVVVAGAASSLIAQAMMLVQADYKGRLGCSTVAQMGFMIVQCGLGFFAAAVTHLIVHGFYKAYLFLSTGSQVVEKPPRSGKTDGGSSLLPSAVALAVAVVGGVLFAVLTGKGLDPAETSIFLVVIVVVSVFQAAAELLENSSIPPFARAIGVPVVTLPAIAVYAGVYNGVYALLHDLPMISVHVEMTAAHWLILALFVAGHLITRIGWLRGNKRLYVALLNAAQADPRTVPASASEYEN